MEVFGDTVFRSEHRVVRGSDTLIPSSRMPTVKSHIIVCWFPHSLPRQLSLTRFVAGLVLGAGACLVPDLPGRRLDIWRWRLELSLPDPFNGVDKQRDRQMNHLCSVDVESGRSLTGAFEFRPRRPVGLRSM